MALLNSFEAEGNWLFKRRSYLPLILFVLAIPAVTKAAYGTVYPRNALAISIVAMVVSVLGLAIRAYTIGTTPHGTSGRNTEEQVAESLNSTGIYSLVRHPLYLGNYLMWIGIVMYTLNFYFVIIVSLMYWLYYERIMFAEERFLERKFGQAFLNWSSKAPAFLPAFRKMTQPSVPFSFVSVLRREYSGFFATVLGFIYVDVLRNLSIGWEFEKKYIPDQVVILTIAGMLTILLRTLKHNTNLLNEAGRS